MSAGNVILVIDDTPSNLKMVASILGPAGYEVLVAISAEDALEVIRRRTPNLIILDYVLPGMDGIDFCRHIKNDSALARIPVIFASVRQSPEHRVAGLEAGAVDYIGKPLHPQEVLSRVSIHLRLSKMEELEQAHLELSKSQQALKEQEAILRKSQRAAQLGSWKWNVKDDQLDWSDEIYRIFGISRQTVVNQMSDAVAQYVHADDAERVTAALLLARSKHHVSPLECRIVRPDGGIRNIWAEADELLLDATGNPVEITGIIQDVTHRKAIEQRNDALERHLADAARMEAIGRLAGGVAHDFNNMLGVMGGYTELILEDPALQPVNRERLQYVMEAIERSSNLVRQLLTFARRQNVNPTVVHLSSTIHTLKKMLVRILSEEITLTIDVDRDTWPLLIDPVQVDQLLINLCVNSKDAISQRGTIDISIQNIHLHAPHQMGFSDVAAGEYVRISVSDDGIGMDSQTLSHVFEPFFTTKETGHGTGLGLATVFGIVTQNHGAIKIDSQPGKGTAVSILLPRHHLAKDPISQTESDRSAIPQTGNYCILVVEDEVSLSQLTSQYLRQQGCSVLTAQNGEEAISVYRTHPEIDLVISDVIMPNMNGIELIAALQQINSKLKYLLMTGYTPDSLTEKGIQLSDAILQKPFKLRHLRQRIEDIMQKDDTSSP